MKFVPESVSVAEGDGFKNDVLDRSVFGERLTNLVLAIGTPSTLVLDGPWGAGKTTFVSMWADTLKAKKIPLIYFNAFENDYVNDAFTAIAGEFVAANAKSTSSRNKLVGVAVKIGKNLAIHGGRYAVKAATLGAVDLLELSDVAKEVTKDLSKDASDSTATLIKKKLVARNEERSAMDKFRAELAAFVAEIADESKSDANKPSPPLIFVIDELDRCRPDFALALVESVKHLFSVPGVIFLLVTNLDQLCSTVQATYGAGINARVYLEKFYHLLVHLPEPQRSANGPRLGAFLKRIFASLPSDIQTPNGRGHLHDQIITHLQLLSLKKGLSLRKLERLSTQIAVVYASTTQQQLRLAPLIADLCLMKLDAPETYARARNGVLTVGELERFLPYAQWHTDAPEGESHEVLWAANLWRYFLESDLLGNEDRSAYAREFFRYSLRTPRRLIPFVCDWIDGFAFPTSTTP